MRTSISACLLCASLLLAVPSAIMAATEPAIPQQQKQPAELIKLDEMRDYMRQRGIQHNANEAAPMFLQENQIIVKDRSSGEDMVRGFSFPEFHVVLPKPLPESQAYEQLRQVLER